jgi:hypothetical protein
MTIYKYQKGRIFKSRAVTKALKIHSKSPSNPSETQREDISSAQRWAVGLIDGDGHMSISWSNSNKTKWVPLLK